MVHRIRERRIASGSVISLSGHDRHGLVGAPSRIAAAEGRASQRAVEGDDWVSKVDGPPTPFSRATVAYLQAKAVIFAVAMLILVVVGVIALVGAGM